MLSPGRLCPECLFRGFFILLLNLVSGKFSSGMFTVALIKLGSRDFSFWLFKGDLDRLFLQPFFDGDIGGDNFLDVEWLYNGQLLRCIRRVVVLVEIFSSDSSIFIRWHF